MALHVVDGVIKELVPRAGLPAHTRTLDLADGWAIPGLVDAHVHICHEGRTALARSYNPQEPAFQAALRAANNMCVALSAGVTLVRDVGSFSHRGMEVRSAVETGLIRGPKIVTCGSLITSRAGHVHDIGREVEGVSACTEAVREEVSFGADFIKVTNDPPGLSREELSAITNEAHRLNKLVACHAFTEDAVTLAMDADVDTIEHAAPFDETMATAMCEQRVILVPTLHCAIETCRDTSLSMVDAKHIPMFERWLDNLRENLPLAFQAGVMIAAGTDAGFPPLEFNAVVSEIKALLGVGASALQALRAGTRVAAAACGLTDSHGAISPGMQADIVVLPDDPLKDIDVLRHPRMVIRSGIPV
jgi:imidazolonepropionase-like amidohydrolase